MQAHNDLTCWLTSLNLGQELGAHTHVPLIRYKPHGPIFMEVSHVEHMFLVEAHELTSTNKEVILYEERNPNIIKELQQQARGVLLSRRRPHDDTTYITLIKVSTTKRVMKALGKPSSSILALEALRKSCASLPSTMEPLHFQEEAQPSPSNTPITTTITTTTTHSPPPPPPTYYTFPSTLPPTILTPTQVKERYGFEEASTPPKLKHELQNFAIWSKEDFNFSRGMRYSNSVQEDTLSHQLQCMRAYCGYVTKYFFQDVPSSATLSFYKDPQHLASFVAYLKARGSQRGHLMKHISLAKKVNFYLKATSIPPTTSSSSNDNNHHFNKLDEWLCTVEAQVSQAMPSTTRPRVDGDRVLRWASKLSSQAMAMVEEEMQIDGGGGWGGELSWRTSSFVQGALVASLVVGAHVPPLRLNFIKTLNHPKYLPHLKCTDPDCKRGPSCLGNHLKEVPRGGGGGGGGEEEVVHHEGEEDDDGWPFFGYATTNLVMVVVHGKNDRRGVGVDLEFTLPRGDFTKLLLTHMHKGHGTLTLTQHPPQTRLFVTKGGKAFLNDSTFTQYWQTLVTKCPIANDLGIKYFAPNEARRMFVEEYTSLHGVPPSLWEGASHVMGNSTRQWESTYNPSRKNRRAQEAVDAHTNYMNKRHQQGGA